MKKLLNQTLMSPPSIGFAFEITECDSVAAATSLLFAFRGLKPTACILRIDYLATIYSVTTKYLFCDKHTDSTIRWVIESPFACFKNKFGDWICPVDSVPKFLEQIYLPNK